MYELTTEDGRSIKTTANHPYLVKNQKIPQSGTWDSANDSFSFELTPNNIVSQNPDLSNKNKGAWIAGESNPSESGVNPKLEPLATHANTNITQDINWVKVSQLHPGMEIGVVEDKGVKFVKIASIEYVGEEQVYDIEVEGTHNFVGNGIVAHNTYIEKEGEGLAERLNMEIPGGDCMAFNIDWVDKAFAGAGQVSGPCKWYKGIVVKPVAWVEGKVELLKGGVGGPGDFYGKILSWLGLDWGNWWIDECGKTGLDRTINKIMVRLGKDEEFMCRISDNYQEYRQENRLEPLWSENKPSQADFLAGKTYYCKEEHGQSVVYQTMSIGKIAEVGYCLDEYGYSCGESGFCKKQVSDEMIEEFEMDIYNEVEELRSLKMRIDRMIMPENDTVQMVLDLAREKHIFIHFLPIRQYRQYMEIGLLDEQVFEIVRVCSQLPESFCYGAEIYAFNSSDFTEEQNAPYYGMRDEEVVLLLNPYWSRATTEKVIIHEMSHRLEELRLGISREGRVIDQEIYLQDNQWQEKIPAIGEYENRTTVIEEHFLGFNKWVGWDVILDKHEEIKEFESEFYSENLEPGYRNKNINEYIAELSYYYSQNSQLVEQGWPEEYEVLKSLFYDGHDYLDGQCVDCDQLKVTNLD